MQKKHHKQQDIIIIDFYQIGNVDNNLLYFVILTRGCSSVVERYPDKIEVVGSIPTTRTL